MAKSPVGGCVDSTTHVPDMGECEGSLHSTANVVWNSFSTP